MPSALHQAVDEVEVGLAVLRAVVARGVGGLQVEVKLGLAHAAADEHRGEDLGGRLLLEDAAVGALLEPPDPRDHGQLVEGVAPRVADVLGLTHEAVDVALALDAVDRQQHVLADEVRDGQVRACDLEAKLEEARYRLVAAQAHDLELLVAAVDGAREHRTITKRGRHREPLSNTRSECIASRAPRPYSSVYVCWDRSIARPGG
jgi:hypothetical protein